MHILTNLLLSSYGDIFVLDLHLPEMQEQLICRTCVVFCVLMELSLSVFLNAYKVVI